MVKTKEIFLILHNVRSSQNVGAIFRVADAAGASKIYLTGYTPAPRDRFGRPNRQVIKTALGAEKFVKWAKFQNISKLISKLKAESLSDGKAGYKLIALEISPKSVDYRKVKITGPTVIIVGNEVRGLSPKILTRCDLVAEIPMRGRKESLNVAVALGVFLFSLF
ncbi:MAG: TrmH family RNA methyltransferase [Candidatus Vogelbacteria bacterium]|nr:TrmH family RNA methyltransferase [Candidatus Vogelbacteria bacterium]